MKAAFKKLFYFSEIFPKKYTHEFEVNENMENYKKDIKIMTPITE